MLNRTYRKVTGDRLAAEMGDAFVVALRGARSALVGAGVSAFGAHAVKLEEHMPVAMLRLTMPPQVFAIGKCTRRRRRATRG